jgi:hypothetical protein
MSKRPVWVSDYEAEVLLGFVGEALAINLADHEREVFDEVYARLETIVNGEPDNE